METLIATCPVKSCGLTQDFLLGCLHQNWDDEFIRQKRYLNLNPDDFHGGSPSPMFQVSMGETIVKYEISSHGLNQCWSGTLQDFMLHLAYEVQRRGYIGLSMGDHCCVILWSDGNFYIVDSYVHGEEHLHTYDRPLSKRSFNFASLYDLIGNPTVTQWNYLFDNKSTNLIGLNEIGQFCELEVHY